MSLKQKFFSGLGLTAAIAAFAVAGSAQVTGEEKPKDPNKMERKAGKEGKGAHRGGFGRSIRGGKFGRHGGFGFRGIELSEAQKAQLKAIREANQPDAALHEELKSIMQARRAGSLTDDQKARLQAIRDQQMERAKAIRAQIEAILTNEQKQQIEQRKQEMKQRMELRHQQMLERRQFRKERKGTGEAKPAEKPTDN